MITRKKPEKNRLRRTMMFMNAQKPGLIKDAYIYGSDSIILDLEDAVAENQKDAARFSLYQALKNIDYGDTEVIVRINGLDTPHWQEDIRCVVAGGADGIRIAKCESAADVKLVEEHVLAAEKEFGIEEGRTLLMAALESPLGIMNAYEIVTASDRMFGCAISGGDFRKSMYASKKAVSRCWLPEVRCLWQQEQQEFSALIRCSRTLMIWKDSKKKSSRIVRWDSMERALSTRNRLNLYIRPLHRLRKRSHMQRSW